MKKKILILGASGLLGLHLINYLKKYHKDFELNIFKRFNKYNFNNDKFCSRFLKIKKFDFIINLSAITDIDFCKTHKRLSKAVNYGIVNLICKNILKFNLKCHLIHISTDQIYKKYINNFEDKFSIINYYSRTKILAEKECLKVSSTILRTNFFGKSLDNKRLSFSDWIYSNLKNNNKIYLATDILFSPVRIKTLCKIIYLCLLRKKIGIFNIGSNKGFSKYDFSIYFAKLLKLKKNLIFKTKLQKLNLVEKRHKDMRMQLRKFEKFFDYKLPSLKNEIRDEIVNYE
jgi:dTDP-4-dehydrorhamnose reductase